MVVVADEEAGFRVVGDTVRMWRRVYQHSRPRSNVVDERTGKHRTRHHVRTAAGTPSEGQGRADRHVTGDGRIANWPPITSVRDYRQHRWSGATAPSAKLHAELRATKRSGRPRVMVVVSAEPGLGERNTEGFGSATQWRHGADRSVRGVGGGLAAGGARRCRGIGVGLLERAWVPGQDAAGARLPNTSAAVASAALAQGICRCSWVSASP